MWYFLLKEKYKKCQEKRLCGKWNRVSSTGAVAGSGGWCQHAAGVFNCSCYTWIRKILALQISRQNVTHHLANFYYKRHKLKKLTLNLRLPYNCTGTRQCHQASIPATHDSAIASCVYVLIGFLYSMNLGQQQGPYFGGAIQGSVNDVRAAQLKHEWKTTNKSPQKHHTTQIHVKCTTQSLWRI